MMSPRRSGSKPRLDVPPAGIYELAGTMDGQEAWIAYDHAGECAVESGEFAYWNLVKWLKARGVKVSSSAPLLFLA